MCHFVFCPISKGIPFRNYTESLPFPQPAHSNLVHRHCDDLHTGKMKIKEKNDDYDEIICYSMSRWRVCTGRVWERNFQIDCADDLFDHSIIIKSRMTAVAHAVMCTFRNDNTVCHIHIHTHTGTLTVCERAGIWHDTVRVCQNTIIDMNEIHVVKLHMKQYMVFGEAKLLVFFASYDHYENSSAFNDSAMQSAPCAFRPIFRNRFSTASFI